MNDLETKIAGLGLPTMNESLRPRVESEIGLASVAGLVREKTPAPVGKSRWFAWPAKLVIGAAVLAAFSAFAFWPNENGQQVLFAHVQEAVMKIKTMEYTYYSVHYEGLGERGIPVRNEDFSYRTVTDIHGWTKDVAKSLAVRLADVNDDATQDELAVFLSILGNHSEKDQGELEFAFRARVSNGRKRYESFFPDEIITLDLEDSKNEIDRMTLIPEDAIESLGERTIDGMISVGFRATEEMNDGLVKRDYWVDKNTKLPILIESSWQPDDDSEPKEKGVYKHFVYNQPIAEILFDPGVLKLLIEQQFRDGYEASKNK